MTTDRGQGFQTPKCESREAHVLWMCVPVSTPMRVCQAHWPARPLGSFQWGPSCPLSYPVALPPNLCGPSMRELMGSPGVPLPLRQDDLWCYKIKALTP